MNKFLIAASFSLLATSAMAQQATSGAAQPGTAVNGVDSSTSGGQGTGSGADMAKKPIIEGTDNMSTGSMTPDTAASAPRKTLGSSIGGNSNATTTVNGVDSSTSGGQGTGSGADMAKPAN